MHNTLSSTPVRFDPSVEAPAEDEAEISLALNETMERIQQTTFENGRHAMRSVHVKPQGVLHATLVVEAGLPPPLAQGLFASPGRYDALLRFSTNAGDVLDDAISLPRGLAVKVVGVDGERLPGSEGDRTQNFVLVDSPAFSASSPKKFLANLKPLAASTDRAEGAKKVVSATAQALERVVEAFGGKSATLLTMGGHPKTHVLASSFFSAAACRHGDYIAKLRVAPASPELLALVERKVDLDGRRDGLREDLVAFMRTHRAEWTVSAQLCTDLEEMPIEDPSVEWDEKRSPYLTVARLVAEPQLAWSPAIATAVDERLFFSPWRGLAAHRPLGGINRARKEAYERSARFRSERNGEPVVEPADLSAFPA